MELTRKQIMILNRKLPQYLLINSVNTTCDSLYETTPQDAPKLPLKRAAAPLQSQSNKCMKEMLETLMAHPVSYPFRCSAEHLDLESIYDSLHQGKYESAKELRRDLREMLETVLAD